MKRLHPQEIEGIYSQCQKCGAVGGIARNSKGGLYMHWTIAELAPSYRKQESD